MEPRGPRPKTHNGAAHTSSRMGTNARMSLEPVHKMSVAFQDNSVMQDDAPPDPIVVVGAGPVGIQASRELIKRLPDTPIVIYGDEPWEPYNRVKLSSLLAGDETFAALLNVIDNPEQSASVSYVNSAVVEIDRQKRRVIDRNGQDQSYRKLILATGSRPHVPSIPGIDLKGVYTFRDLSDAQELMARRVRSRRTVVLGGGLLGLEAARAMQRLNTEVCVIEHSVRLMFNQLDDEAADLLKARIEHWGIDVVLDDGVQQILGEDGISGLRLRSGRELECDTLIVATGIRPHIELARAAGIAVGRGIRVNDHLQTSDPDIYAVGECVEHQGKVYGLVAPGLEQAAVAVHNIAGGASAYHGSDSVTSLKVVGSKVFSMGSVEDDNPSLDALTYRNAEQGIYRKLMLHRQRLVGAIAMGEWDELGRLQEALTHRRRLWPWQRRGFLKEGLLWPDAQGQSVTQWPAGATVCNCTGVTRGCLSDAIGQGACTVEAQARETGASSVCGSCRPLLVELTGAEQPAEPVRAFRTLAALALLGLVATLLFALLPALPYNASVADTLQWDALWREGLLKQISGYTLLGMSVLVLLLSLRKRLTRFTWLDFSIWRVVHALLGGGAIAALILHTGLRLGENLNFYLMAAFLGLLGVGGLAAGVIAMEHRMNTTLARRLRSLSLWGHILLFWPVPVLLGFHVLKTYFF